MVGTRPDIAFAVGLLGRYSTPLTNITTYRNIVGKLMYAMVGTRPDIAFAVGLLGRYSQAPTEHHLQMAKRVVRYLKHTKRAHIRYRHDTHKTDKSDINVTIFIDADYANDISDRRSITGYLSLINDSPVSWTSKKQQTVALSSTEAEYMAASEGVREALWTRRLLQELSYVFHAPLTIREDNNSTIHISQNPIHHARTKHIDVRHHFIRECVQSGDVQMTHIPTQDQLADILTKALVKVKHYSIADRIMQFCD